MSENVKWLISSVVVPLACAFIGGFFGYMACNVKITKKIKNRDINHSNVIQNSDSAQINKRP